MLSLVLALPAALYLPFTYALQSQPALASNVLALSFAASSTSLLALDSFPTAATLFAGLLAYDVWWVFGTPVMVDVARRLEAPVKIVLEKGGKNKGYTMLGLGDIIVPGTSHLPSPHSHPHSAELPTRS